MDINLLCLKNNHFYIFIILFLTQIKPFCFSTCKPNDDFNSKTCFNDILIFNKKNYRAGQICTNNKNILSIEYSDQSPGNSRLFYSLLENGRGFFQNENSIKEITLTSDKYHEGKKIIGRYESFNAFVSLESDIKKEKQYLLSISSNISLTELYDLENDIYQQWVTTDFLNIKDENRYIISPRFSFLELKNTNIYFLVYIQYGGTDSQGKDISNSYTISKFSFKKNDIITVNHLNRIEDNNMYNCRVVSATIVDMHNTLVVAYIQNNSKLTLKFYNYDLEEINSCLVEGIIYPRIDQFLKIELCRDNYIAIIFFTIGEDGSSKKLSFYKINKYSVSNKFYLEHIFSHYGSPINLKSDASLNDFYKMNDNRFIFVSTAFYTKLCIFIIETDNSYRSLNLKDYYFNLESTTNNYQFTKELSLGMYKGFLLFTSTISSNKASDNYFSYLIFFGYANGTDFNMDISPYLADMDEYDTNNDFVTYLLDKASIDNNIFSYNLIRKIKLISIPKEILIYKKYDLTNPITDGTIIDEGNYILLQNEDVIKTDKLYELEYQYMVQEPTSYISNNNGNGQILFGRVNKLSMKLCHEFCGTCNKLGISNNKQYCLSCLEPYTYDYFTYFNIFESNCVPEGYYIDIENDQLIECSSTEYKYYFNKTDNNKKICFKYDYDCPISYNYFNEYTHECSNYIYDLDVDLKESYVTEILSNLTSIINAYVYLDIAQNPQIFNPAHSTHSPIDLISTLENVKKENRKFYEFYREIKEIIGTVRDMHFSIFPLKSPNGKKFGYITACIPFSFIIDKDINDNKIKVYIKYFKRCAIFYDDNIRNYIKTKEDSKIALKLINGQDPFKYIQNWGWKFNGVKSPHGQFSKAKNKAHCFYLNLYPYTPEELKIKYEFESNNNKEDFIILDSYIIVPNKNALKNLFNFDKELLFSFNEEEFDLFFREEMEKNVNIINKPNIFQIIDKYAKKKGILKEKPKIKEIEWDFETKEEKGIKCRVDNVNQVNVFLQQSFHLNFTKTLGIIIECINLFYSNNYPIIGIENQNYGGDVVLAQIFHQFLQIKIQGRTYFSGRSTDIYKKFSIHNIIDVETCQEFKDMSDFMDGIEDDYSNNTKTIFHKRTKTFEFGSKYYKEWVYEKRKYFKDNGIIKKPTDIIIFTDGFSFSAASIFIKGFQKTGGAITVGFNGNPHLSNDLFDASQSPSLVMDFNNTIENQNLKQLGFEIVGISYAETFGDNYKEKNEIPLEYDFDPVDERVDIYNEYSDEIYQNFIDKGKEIFKKYNQDKKCNKKNKKLLLDPNDGKTCYKFDNDEHAHGGYICNDDGTWSDICVPYYCDFGYFFNTHIKKCVKYKCIESDEDQQIQNIKQENGINDIKIKYKNISNNIEPKIDENKKENKKRNKDKYFPFYAVVLISICSFFILLMMIKIIIKFICRDKKNSERLETLMINKIKY